MISNVLHVMAESPLSDHKHKMNRNRAFKMGSEKRHSGTTTRKRFTFMSEENNDRATEEKTQNNSRMLCSESENILKLSECENEAG